MVKSNHMFLLRNHLLTIDKTTYYSEILYIGKRYRNLIQNTKLLEVDYLSQLKLWDYLVQCMSIKNTFVTFSCWNISL